jgi:hypothetical protein
MFFILCSKYSIVYYHFYIPDNSESTHFWEVYQTIDFSLLLLILSVKNYFTRNHLGELKIWKNLSPQKNLEKRYYKKVRKPEK